MYEAVLKQIFEFQMDYSQWQLDRAIEASHRFDALTVGYLGAAFCSLRAKSELAAHPFWRIGCNPCTNFADQPLHPIAVAGAESLTDEDRLKIHRIAIMTHITSHGEPFKLTGDVDHAVGLGKLVFNWEVQLSEDVMRKLLKVWEDPLPDNAPAFDPYIPEWAKTLIPSVRVSEIWNQRTNVRIRINHNDITRLEISGLRADFVTAYLIHQPYFDGMYDSLFTAFKQH